MSTYFKIGCVCRNITSTSSTRFITVRFKLNQTKHQMNTTSSQFLQIRSKTIYSLKRPKYLAKYSKDRVGENYELVFENRSNRAVYWSQPVIYGLMLPTTAYNIYQIINSLQTTAQYDFSHPALMPIFISMCGLQLMIFTYFTVRSHVLRIYHKPDTDNFILVHQLWNMMSTKLDFTLLDCERINRQMISNVNIKSKSFYVTKNSFKLPVYYNKIMRFDA